MNSFWLKEWEFNHSPIPVTSCANCGEVLCLDSALKKEYYNGKHKDVEHFCNNDCHHIWHINRLNTLGM